MPRLLTHYDPAYAKPTPRPWTSEPGASRGAWIKGANGEWAALACGDTDATARANAALICGAPDLLSAAREIDRFLLVIESAVRNADPSQHRAVLSALMANKDAIAKADGPTEDTAIRELMEREDEP